MCICIRIETRKLRGVVNGMWKREKIYIFMYLNLIHFIPFRKFSFFSLSPRREEKNQYAGIKKFLRIMGDFGWLLLLQPLYCVYAEHIVKIIPSVVILKGFYASAAKGFQIVPWKFFTPCECAFLGQEIFANFHFMSFF